MPFSPFRWYCGDASLGLETTGQLTIGGASDKEEQLATEGLRELVWAVDVLFPLH